MKTFKNQCVSEEQCPMRLGPEERRNALQVTRNFMLEDLEFIDCDLASGGLTTYGAPVHRSTARNIRLKNCRVNSYFGTGAIFDEVVIDGLRTTRSPVILSGCAFRHVTLRGDLGRFLINRDIPLEGDKRNEAFRDANAAFYETVDWALDITDAKPACLELRGAIPVQLIRRNPDEHFIMTRDAAQSSDWWQYDPHDAFQISVSDFLTSGADQELFVAPRRSRHFTDEVAFFHRLRDAGLVT